MTTPGKNREMYCLGCYYDLRGLPENRCPECGRTFDPERASTFSRVAKPTPVRDWFGRVMQSIDRALQDPPDPLTRLRRGTSALAIEVDWLRRSNEVLRLHLDLVLNVMIEKGLLTEAEMDEFRRMVERSAVMQPFETIEPEDPRHLEILEDPSPALVELSRAVDAVHAEPAARLAELANGGGEDAPAEKGDEGAATH